LNWSLPGLRKTWNGRKHSVAPWWSENSKEAYNTGLDALARALGNWSDSKNGTRAGKPAGFPRFKTRRSRKAVRFTTGTIRVEPGRHHITLPRLGRIKTHESTRKLARRVEAGTARILSATLSRGTATPEGEAA
jgi:putative transposase